MHVLKRLQLTASVEGLAATAAEASPRRACAAAGVTLRAEATPRRRDWSRSGPQGDPPPPTHCPTCPVGITGG